jgi:DNA-binding CsgD family transcriptional regulator
MPVEYKSRDIRIHRGWVYNKNILENVIDLGKSTNREYEPNRQPYFVFKEEAGEVIFCAFSQYADSIIGSRARDYLGLSIRELYKNRPGLSEVLNTCMVSKNDQSWEGWYTFHSDGSTRYVTALCEYIEPNIVVISGKERYRIESIITADEESDCVTTKSQKLNITSSSISKRRLLSRAKLSHREHEVAERIFLGMTNSEIARSMYIQECTVKKHISAILSKTGMSSRVEFILYFGRF